MPTTTSHDLLPNGPDVGGDRVVGEALLEQARQRGPHHRPVDALLVHHHDAGLGLEDTSGDLDVPRRRRELELLVGGGHRVGVLELELELRAPGARPC